MAITARASFESVYAEALPAVWRVVSARIPDRGEAEDVTSDVFVRALQSWPRYDSALGTPTAWLCGIAQRTIADWWRSSRRAMKSGVVAFAEDTADGHENDPESAALRAEQLDALRRGLAALGERERDALVLRFAAGLRAGEVGVILGISAGATRMLLFRTLLKLKEWLARASSPTYTQEEESAEVLERAIDDVLERRAATIPDPLLQRVVRFMAVLREAEVPPELPTAIRVCLECEERNPAPEMAVGGSGFASMRSRFPAVLRSVTVPACVVCAAGPGIVPPLTALGLAWPALIFHISSIALAPLNLLLLWRRSRVHGVAQGFLIGAMGVVLILVHMGVHIADLDNAVGMQIQDALVLGGTALLTIGWLLDWRATRRIAYAWKAAPA